MIKNILILFCLIAFGSANVVAQSTVVNENDLILIVSLSEDDADNAKQLKGLKNSILFKGESRTVYLLKINQNELGLAKSELKSLFTSAVITEMSGTEYLQGIKPREK